jgi:ABC-type glutathione transport system ATPase component
MDELMLKVEGLSKVFRRLGVFGKSLGHTHAVAHVSFELPTGRTLGIVGESGSGKTTLARVIAGLEPQSSGTIRIGPYQVPPRADERREFRRTVQVVFQDPHSALNPRWRIARSLGEALRLRGIPRAQRPGRIAELLELVGIDPDRSRDYPHQFSGGQKQRIVIARALAVEPELLILDEPVSSLDVSIQAQILNLLARIKEEFSLTYLFISHDLNLVAYFCDLIGVMRRGELVEFAPAETLLTSPAHEYTKALFSASPHYEERRLLTPDLTRRKV